jgi:glycosyltransferase involved in cell wall biosynthesis
MDQDELKYHGRTPVLTVAVCTYNRADLLHDLVVALRQLHCPVPFEILVVDNNSADHTQTVLAALARAPGAPLRHVQEFRQGIVHARNRAIEEALGSDYLLFMDDDELPFPTQLQATLRALDTEQADCAGGKYVLKFLQSKPRWLTPDLYSYLGHLDHGEQAFWIDTPHTPLWTGNITFRTALFRQHPDLRFDTRFNRIGESMGGGEDLMMFRQLLAMGKRIRYRPDMAIHHLIPPRRMVKRYFIKHAWSSGLHFGRCHLLLQPATGRTGLRLKAAANFFLQALLKSITFSPDAFSKQLLLIFFCGKQVNRFVRRTKDAS